MSKFLRLQYTFSTVDRDNISPREAQIRDNGATDWFMPSADSGEQRMIRSKGAVVAIWKLAEWVMQARRLLRTRPSLEQRVSPRPWATWPAGRRRQWRPWRRWRLLPSQAKTRWDLKRIFPLINLYTIYELIRYLLHDHCTKLSLLALGGQPFNLRNQFV